MTVRQLRDMLHAIPADGDHLPVFLYPDGQEMAEAWEITFLPLDNVHDRIPCVIIADCPRLKAKNCPLLITEARKGC